MKRKLGHHAGISRVVRKGNKVIIFIWKNWEDVWKFTCLTFLLYMIIRRCLEFHTVGLLYKIKWNCVGVFFRKFLIWH
jgi:hypothetical protein